MKAEIGRDDLKEEKKSKETISKRKMYVDARKRLRGETRGKSQSFRKKRERRVKVPVTASRRHRFRCDDVL